MGPEVWWPLRGPHKKGYNMTDDERFGLGFVIICVIIPAILCAVM